MSEVKVNTMKMYKVTTSFSHVLGNLTVIIENYIKDTMPTNYFKQTRATTEAAFKDIKDLRKNLIENEKPYLILDPKLIMGDESDSLPRMNWDRFIPIDHKTNPEFYAMNSEFFLKNDELKYALGYTFNRYKLNFRVVMIVDTQMMRLSLMNYVMSNFRFRHMFPIERYTETLIPQSYIAYIADKLSMDITSSDFLTELNRRSSYSIVRLHRPGTGKTEFFILTPSTIQLKLPDFPSEDRTMIGRIERYSQIEFNIEVETNIMNNFLLMATDIIDKPDEPMTDYMVRIEIESQSPVVDNIVEGKMLYTKINLEFDQPEETVDLLQFLGTDVKNEINYMNSNNIIADYMKILVFKWKDPVDTSDTAFVEIDMSKPSITLKQIEMETVYSVLIYLDMAYLTNITKFINEDTLNTTGVD